MVGIVVGGVNGDEGFDDDNDDVTATTLVDFCKEHDNV